MIRGALALTLTAVVGLTTACGTDEVPAPGSRATQTAADDVQPVEIEQMVDWLVSWGEPIPATSRDHVNADGHGDLSGMEGMDELPGMMSQDSMEALGEADDSAFEAMFLEMMIEHHEGAIAMAVAEQDDGLFPDVLSLAATTEETQRAEVGRMRRLLDQIG